MDGSYSDSASVRLPEQTGSYYVIVKTDAADTPGAVVEGVEGNNLTVAPIAVNPAYGATVSTPVTVAGAGTPIPLSGLATSTPSIIRRPNCAS